LNGLKRALIGREKLQLDDIFVLAGQVSCFKVLNLNRTFDKWDQFVGKDISDYNNQMITFSIEWGQLQETGLAETV
jgi:hypothetical protein